LHEGEDNAAPQSADGGAGRGKRERREGLHTAGTGSQHQLKMVAFVEIDGQHRLEMLIGNGAIRGVNLLLVQKGILGEVLTVILDKPAHHVGEAENEPSGKKFRHESELRLGQQPIQGR